VTGGREVGKGEGKGNLTHSSFANLTALCNVARDFSFWQYKVCAGVRRGSLDKRHHKRQWGRAL